MEVCSSTEMGALGASHLGTGDHGSKTDRSRPRSVLINALLVNWLISSAQPTYEYLIDSSRSALAICVNAEFFWPYTRLWRLRGRHGAVSHFRAGFCEVRELARRSDQLAAPIFVASSMSMSLPVLTSYT
jgi:hypothetical protein